MKHLNSTNAYGYNLRSQVVSFRRVSRIDTFDGATTTNTGVTKNLCASAPLRLIKASYIRVSDEEDMNAEYYVVVLRGDDNVVLRSCPIIYHGGSMRDSLTDVRGEKTAIKVIEDGVLYIIRDGIKYTVLGTITEHIQ